jgi:hypothetical protein
MRFLCTVLFFSAVLASPTNAQSSSPSTSSGSPSWEFGLGAVVAYRDSSLSPGGGLTLARRFDRFAGTFEGSIVRREGHNDWRAAGGPRAIFGAGGDSSYFVQVLAGTFIRQSTANWAVLPGAGFDAAIGGKRALRFQMDVPVERDQDRTVTSVRGSVWIIF